MRVRGAHAVAEPEGSDSVRLSAEEFFAEDDWDKSIELARRYLAEVNLKIALGMSEEDVYTAAERLAGGEDYIVTDLDVLRGPSAETQAEFDNLPDVEKLIRLIELTGGRYYRGDELKRELAENAPTVVEENPDAAEKLDRLLVRMDEVETRRVEWLWRDRIPSGP